MTGSARGTTVHLPAGKRGRRGQWLNVSFGRSRGLDPATSDGSLLRACCEHLLSAGRLSIRHWRGLKWCHLLADDVDELHRFAARLGIKRTSFQSPPKVTVPHYDLTGYERLRAIAMDAVLCDRHQIVAVLRRMRPR